jgi:prepilin-type N-terminal cleavage/methylation domain-containing protein
MKTRRAQIGFSLVELLIVTAILSVLMAVVWQNVGGVLSAARHAAFNQDRRTIQMAVDTYYAAIRPGKYPTADLTTPGVISFTRLVDANSLRMAPLSAGQPAHPDGVGLGTYTWYLDAGGAITTTYSGTYP